MFTCWKKWQIIINNIFFKKVEYFLKKNLFIHKKEFFSLDEKKQPSENKLFTTILGGRKKKIWPTSSKKIILRYLNTTQHGGRIVGRVREKKVNWLYLTLEITIVASMAHMGSRIFRRRTVRHK